MVAIKSINKDNENSNRVGDFEEPIFMSLLCKYISDDDVYFENEKAFNDAIENIKEEVIGYLVENSSRLFGGKSFSKEKFKSCLKVDKNFSLQPNQLYDELGTIYNEVPKGKYMKIKLNIPRIIVEQSVILLPLEVIKAKVLLTIRTKVKAKKFIKEDTTDEELFWN
jgi:hypothetical protein